MRDSLYYCIIVVLVVPLLKQKPQLINYQLRFFTLKPFHPTNQQGGSIGKVVFLIKKQ
jgi:hypothetical protein